MTSPLPGPWISHATASDSPWLSQQGIIKFLEFPVRTPVMSRREFHLYWQRHHSPHVMNTTGFSQFMRKYLTAHVHATDRVNLPAYLQSVPRFEGVGEVWLNSLEDAIAWLGHPLYEELIAPDEAKFLDRDGGGEVIVAREERLLDPICDLTETGLTKLYILTKRRTGVDRNEFHRTASHSGRMLLAKQRSRDLLLRFVISHRLPDPYPDWLPPADIDAVFELWFANLEATRTFLADESTGARFPIGDGDAIDAASVRAIVTRLNVVHDEFSFQPTVMQPTGFRWDE